MWSRTALSFPALFAAAASGMSVWKDNHAWSYKPDKTADWYKQHGKPLPEVASDVTFAVLNEHASTNIVKLECLGCPFRVRKYGQLDETWQDPPQDNSLLLNFTLDQSQSSLLLNGHPILDIATHLPGIDAFQVPSNLSSETMGKMMDEKMLDASWVIGTKYGNFELQYEHTLLATERINDIILQFDVTAIHLRQHHNPGSYSLNKEGQKMIQISLSQGIEDHTRNLVINDFQVVDRKDRTMPVKMKCGKYAMVRAEYNPLEWDQYGKIGTWSRTGHVVASRAFDFFESNGLVLIVLAVIFGIVHVLRQRVKRAQEQLFAQEDPEAASLIPEYEAPPEYSDVAQLEEPKEETQDLLGVTTSAAKDDH